MTEMHLVRILTMKGREMRVPTFNGAHDGFHDYLADMDYYFDCYMFDKHEVQFVRMRLVGPTRIS